MKLLIVESPAKAKTIEKYLNKAYTVKASVGHVRDLPKSNKNAIDIEKHFKPHYVISPGKEKVISDLKKITAKADEVVLATDPDREGEAIAWHLKEALGLKDPKRIVFHEITEEAVQKAINQPRKIDKNLFSAQEARRVLDRLFGYDLSGLIWKKLRYGLSAGRVQSPALRILVEREKEIKSFVPEKYWTIEANFSPKEKSSGNWQIPFTCSLEPETEKEANKIVELSQKANWTVESIAESSQKRSPRPPFTTSTLQQAASNRFGYSPSQTMRLAQKLYENGYITYMRTDSTTLSQQALNETANIIKKEFGQETYQPRSYKSKSKNAQEAHEAIRPSKMNTRNAGRTDQEKKIYKLIWQRTVATQMVEAEILRTKVTAVADNNDIPKFTTAGARVVKPGWFMADPEARSEDVEIPKLTEADPLKLNGIEAISKETQGPRRYTEAGLVKELEKRGIGRPSTYAPTIKNIVDRGYVDKDKRSLIATDTGIVVSDFLTEHFTHYVSDSFTAELEDKLDDIAQGKHTYEETLKDFYGPFSKAVKSKNDIPKITDLGEAPADIKCPKCGKSMIIKLSKSGKFYSCSDFPECIGARTMEGKELAGPKETGEDCPDCKNGKLVEREGRFGKFISCSNYPKCKFIKNDENAENPGDTGITCPVCKEGTMVEKRGRFGIFYGCSNYPKCKQAIKAKPTGKICGYMRETTDGGTINGPCPHLMMEGTKTIPERCSDKTCPNHNPHKLAKK